MSLRFLFALLILYPLQYGVCQELPEVIYPSPKAMDFEKYGNIPISTYTGTPNISIPIYTIQQGDIQIPISLSYHASGVKVEEEAGEVGLGWVLNSGGIISRTIYGYNDFETGGGNGNHYHKRTDILDVTKTESATGNRIFPPQAPSTGPVYVNDGSYDISNFIGEFSGYDFEPDHYSYNFLGSTGSFVFSRDGTAHLSKKNDLEISFKNGLNNEGFIIYDGKGFKYTFDAQEKRHVAGNPLSHHVTSWLLKEIESPSGNKVIYNYSDLSSTNIITTLSLTQTSDESSYMGQSAQPGSGPVTCLIDNFTKDHFTHSVYQNRNLQSIDFDSGRLVFEYDSARVDNEGKKLNKIKLYTKDALGQLSTNPIKEFDLTYEYFVSTGGDNVYRELYKDNNGGSDNGFTPDNDLINKRLKLKQFGEAGKQPYVFSYYNEYNPNSFPGKGSFSKDYWGYYNASGVSTLIPEYAGRLLVDDEDYSVLPGADRRANPNVISNFSLESITYPTGGKTEFEYESNTYDLESSSGAIESLNFYEDKEVIEDHSYPFTHVKNNDGDYKSETFTINETVKMEYDIYLRCDSYQPECDIRHSAEVTLLFKSLDGITYDHSNLCANGANQGGDQCNISGVFTLTPGTYTIESSLTGSGLASLSANYTWRTLKSSEDVPMQYGGGQRIKKIYDYASSQSTTPINTREFQYHYTDPVTSNEKSYGKRISPLLYMTEVESWHFLPPICSLCTGDDYMCVTQKRSSNNSLTNSGSLIGYSKVIIDHGENGNYGQSTHEYICETDIADYYTHNIAMPPVPYNSNGLMLKTQEFGKAGNNLVKIKETTNTYSHESKINVNASDLIVGINRRYWNNSYGEIEDNDGVYDKKSVFITYASLKSDWIKLENSVETVYDTNGNNPMTTTTTYEYSNPAHMQLTKTIVTDSKGQVVASESKYAEDLNNTFLINKHMHSVPLWQQQKVDNAIVSTSETVYPQSGLPLPTLIKTSKGNEVLETRVNFHKYDNKGNPTEVSKEDGTPIAYIWGYNQSYPVAMVENATRSQIEALSGFGANFHAGYDGLTAAQESALRGLSNVMVTTYTYNYLIGIASITDPRGYTTYYEYDDLERLIRVKDDDGNVLSENAYHYKGQ